MRPGLAPSAPFFPPSPLPFSPLFLSLLVLVPPLLCASACRASFCAASLWRRVVPAATLLCRTDHSSGVVAGRLASASRRASSHSARLPARCMSPSTIVCRRRRSGQPWTPPLPRSRCGLPARWPPNVPSLSFGFNPRGRTGSVNGKEVHVGLNRLSCPYLVNKTKLLVPFSAGCAYGVGVI